VKARGRIVGRTMRPALQVFSVEVLGQRVGGHTVENVLWVVLPHEALPEVAFEGVNDLLPSAVPDRDVQEQRSW
jgi:hypothetical protein